MNRRMPLVALAGAQFVMVLDQSVMNVSISQLVEDFDTTVTTIQAVITLYCLVDGHAHAHRRQDRRHHRPPQGLRDRPDHLRLRVGLTAVSQSVAALTLGWSILEGIGAALVLPALAALIAGNFEGKERKAAYAVIGGVAGAGIAIGPILGGWATTELSWRIVFVGEVVIVLGHPRDDAVRRATRCAPGPKPRLDVVGAILSAAGLGAVVLGDPAVQHVGLDRAQGLPGRAVRALADALRDRRRGRAPVGLRRGGSGAARRPAATRSCTSTW